jgi:nitrite reductase/ring-hydroxylating ferredoxin subunit
MARTAGARVSGSGRARAMAVAELPEGSLRHVRLFDRNLVLVRDAGGVRAFDARCPHMGYPLSQGHLEPGVLRCDWHHWRFDLATGGCLTFGGVDVPTYPVQIEDGWIWVGDAASAPTLAEDVSLAEDVLRRGLRDGSLFPVAKAAVSLLALGQPPERVALRAVAYAAPRSRGFAPAFTIMACMGRALPVLPASLRPLALTHALSHLAEAVRGRPERPLHPPLRALEDPAAATARLRALVEERQAAGAERILRAALAGGDAGLAVEMCLAAVTDHVFVSTGHVLDELRQALRLCRLLGADADLAGTLLAAVLADAMDGTRHEEEIDWQDALPALAELDRLLAAEVPPPRGRPVTPSQVEHLAELDLPEVLAEVLALCRGGAGVADLARALLAVAVERQGRFSLQNWEDWNDVHHLVTYANAVDALAVRYAAASPAMAAALVRAVSHGFGDAALTRYLNRPRGRYPWERGRLPEPDPEGFVRALAARDLEAGGAQAAALALAGAPAEVVERPFLTAILEEDSSFHLYQNVDVSLRAAAVWADQPERRARVLWGSVRFVLGQKGQRRIWAATRNAQRLLRGELLEAAEAEEDTEA